MLVNVGKLKSIVRKGSLDQSKLLPIGPYRSLTTSLVSGLSDLHANGVVIPFDNTQGETNPQRYNTVTCTGGGSITIVGTNTGRLCIWCDTLAYDGTGLIDVSGLQGDDASYDGTNIFGGNGSAGATGSGGGGASNDTDPSDEIGGDGGTLGTNGGDGTAGPINSNAGFGGGTLDLSAFIFAFPMGGNGSDSNEGGVAGPGFSGGGGGGAGGVAYAGGILGVSAGGGGGAGAGLLSIVTRILQCTNSPGINAAGGNGGAGYGPGDQGSGGGGGSVYIAAMKKTGTLSADVSGGSGAGPGSGSGHITLFEIKKNGSVILHTNLNDTWDNT